eukprot:TRINITY_DN8625_c0_g1_i14.p1 TRINITY_DN8625_c0_g1~~TRINITY_DN8625_c0_g1_i14.p1  ORF type:complete len:296 (-),score=80.32 TRINITY_DN8625_c0_g1_i14:140-1027(-)
MKLIHALFALCAVASCLNDSDMIVTVEYVDYLKKHVSWEVEEYENNIFRGWTVGEMKNFLGLSDTNTYLEGLPDIEEPNHLPSAVNWAGTNCDHSVKNQGTCGACWAFAAANMLSDRCCLYSSDQGWLSVQELLSCDTGSFGCYGGSLTSPIPYMQKNGGLVGDDCLPYTGRKDPCRQMCMNRKDWRRSHACKCLQAKNCYNPRGIKSCLLEGPVPIGFMVCQSFISYKSGIYSCDCKNYVGGHATLAMGYSDKPECNYFVKNSWGEDWGVHGYYNMACETCKLSGGPVCTKVVS